MHAGGKWPPWRAWRRRSSPTRLLGGCWRTCSRMPIACHTITTMPRNELRGCDFSGARMSGINLRRAIMVFARLAGVDLRGAILEGADLSKADLTGADLRGANLYAAETWQAKLVGAKLERAITAGTKLPKEKR